MNQEEFLDEEDNPWEKSKVCRKRERKKAETETVNSQAGKSSVDFGYKGLFEDLSHDDNFRLVCSKCYINTKKEGLYGLHEHEHTCKFNQLAIKSKTEEVWQFLLRKVVTSKAVFSSYKMCPRMNTSECHQICSYPHNEKEMKYWTLEKQKKFSIAEVILELNIARLSINYGGFFAVVCRNCLSEGLAHIYTKPNDSCRKHEVLTDEKTLIHYKDCIIVINSKPEMDTESHKHRLCRYSDSCQDMKKGICDRAHFDIEREVWAIERNCQIERDKVVDFILDHHDERSGKAIPSNSKIKNIKAEMSPGVKTTAASKINDKKAQCKIPDACPYRIRSACKICWLNGTETQECRKHSNDILYLINHKNHQVRNLPKHIPKNLNFKICADLKNTGRPCVRSTCQFAHSQEEIHLWKWMASNKVSSLQSLVNEAGTETNANNKTRLSNAVLLPSSIKHRQLFCDTCSIQFNAQGELSKHLKSADHILKFECDKKGQWNFRSPPWHKDSTSLQLCSLKDCPFTSVSPSFNYCENAHDRDELSEWHERYEWRDMMSKMKKDEDTYEYLEDLQKKYLECSNIRDILCEEMDGVDITCNRELTVVSRPNTNTHWTFTIETKKKIQVKTICLLLNLDRSRFSLVSPIENTCDQWIHLPSQDNNLTSVDVAFKSAKKGFFRQWIIFDFESSTKVVRKLSVEIVDNPSKSTNKDTPEKETEKGLWKDTNREIIRDARILHPTSLSPQWWSYKPPEGDEDIRLKYDGKFPLNRYNYQHKLHSLIANEELSRRRIVSRFNRCTTVSLLDKIEEETFIPAQGGQLFAKVMLDGELSTDAEEGQLFLENVNSALITLEHSTNNRVYEAKLATIDNSRIQGKNYIYLDIPRESVEHLQLQPNTDVILQVQFQINRDTFRNMHYAVDSLSNTEIIFPDISKINSLNWNEREVKCSLEGSNMSQARVIKHIMTKKDYWPPLLVYGPFGTGKTETLAKATKGLLERRPHLRILICTFNNSSADIYITRFLNNFLKATRKQDSVLRVYHPERRYNTVPIECHPYMLYSEQTGKFCIPSIEDIEKKTIVVTTLETAMYLTNPRLHGMFTHIFVDEAAQAFECLVWIPLSLADEKTCVVLTGDHRQMNPKVYSAEGNRQKFGYSILQRLYEYYEDHCRTRFSNVAIFLNENYRSHKLLLRFLSETFYGSGDNLICKSNVPDVNIKPLNFLGVFGQEVKKEYSTSVFNHIEAECIAESVSYVYENWPKAWGEKNEEEIHVTAAYQEQVALIRSILRSKRLRKIKVNTVYTIQGVQCRALFISTVRTKELWQSRNLKKCLEDDDCSILGQYGFLSNPNMLNTALTRAMSAVFVIGDPTTLCTTGECKDIWKKYIKHCHELQSYFCHLKYEDLKKKVEQIESTPEGSKVKQLSEQSYSAMRPYEINDKAAVNPLFAKLQTAYSKCLKESGFQSANKSYKYANQHIPSERKESDDYDDWDDFEMKPDEIIQRLGEELLYPQMDPDLSMNIATRKKNIRYRIKEKEGQAMLYPVKSNRKSRRLCAAEDATGDMDDSSEEEEMEDEHIGEEGNRFYRKEYDKTKLLTFLQENPNKYKRCIINIGAEFQFARVIDLKSDVKEIHFRTKTNCGRALNNDEVLVEILPQSGKTATVPDDQKNVKVYGEILPQCGKTHTVPDDQKNVKVYGEVVGILNRAMNPRYKVFVCRTDSINTGLMIPLNKSLPPIYNLSVKGHKDGSVSVYRFENYHPKFEKDEPIDPVNPSSKLFMVRFLKWSRKNRLPLGIVIGVQPVGDNLENGLFIIKKEHHIAERHYKVVTDEMDRLNFDLTSQMMGNRRNLIWDTNCFTIDSISSQDLDDALSCDWLGGDKYRIGIHIADVTHFIDKDCNIDKAIFKRGTSYYPKGREPIHMLPPKLMRVCSLTPKEDKLAISIFLHLKNDGEILGLEFCKSIIRSRRRFTCNEIQDILSTEEDENNLCWSVKQLFTVSQLWRKQRIGKPYCHNDVDPVDVGSGSAHVLVEEMMIMANYQIAKLLSQKYPDYFPLRVHQAPDEYSQYNWQRMNYKAVLNVVSLNNGFHDNGQVCHCPSACISVSQFMSMNNLKSSDSIVIPFDVLESLFSAADCLDFQTFTSLLLSPENYPDSAVALSEYRGLLKKSFYYCTHNTDDPSLYIHFGLKYPVYVHYTSPIRRYFDIAVHRMVSSYISDSPNPYSEDELETIARRCNIANLNSQSYDKATLSLHLSVALQKKPLICYPVIKKVNLEAIHLVFPSIKFLQDKERRIPMMYLSPSFKPNILEEEMFDDQQRVELQWRERIYNLHKTETTTKYLSHEAVELNDQTSMQSIPRTDWQGLLDCVCGGDWKRTIEVLNKIRRRISRNECAETLNEELHKMIQYTDPISKEKCKKSKVILFRKFNKTFERYQRLRVQLAPELQNGILIPRIQLYFLTPKFAICLQHRRDPIGCFSTLASRTASQKPYEDLMEYQNLWLPVIAMESVTASVRGKEQIFIHNVSIEWVETEMSEKDGDSKMRGTFRIPVDFCTERLINLGEDYVCVRYNDISVSQDLEENDEISCIVDKGGLVTFICHCVIGSVCRKDSEYLCSMLLHECTMPFPQCLLENNGRPCSMEIIPKSLPERRVQRAVERLKSAPQLTKTIAVGESVDESGKDYEDIERLMAMPLTESKLNPLNEIQERVTKNALRGKFTLIQGPPGTGKTVTGVYIAMYFCKRNEDTGKHVLYCGPSNKSVDVVVEKLLDLGETCPSLVRVYGERIENSEFPLPRNPVPYKNRSHSDISKNPEVRKRALHNLIRLDTNALGNIIRKYDQLFSLVCNDVLTENDIQVICMEMKSQPKMDDMSSAYLDLILTKLFSIDEKYTRKREAVKKVICILFEVEAHKEKSDDIIEWLIMKYKETINTAKKVEIKRHSLILSTCMASGADRLERIAKVRQIIIDEAAMCTEPESMIPLSIFEADNIVLIGDHKQLQPVINEEKAKRLGLNISLFERYCKQASMLELQYRMHAGIMEFPSQMFYEGRLKCGTKVQSQNAELDVWPAGQKNPCVLCHTEGEEITLTVATEEGSELSKSNMTEVEYSVKAARNLVRRYRKTCNDIVILSQYRAQCSAIKKRLEEENLQDIHVSTVISSQGSEWKYVIFSTVRSLPEEMIEEYPSKSWIRKNLGFISDDHQMNVAITRAKNGLIIIGNKNMLRCDNTWKKLTENYEKRGLIVDAENYALLK